MEKERPKPREADEILGERPVSTMANPEGGLDGRGGEADRSLKKTKTTNYRTSTMVEDERGPLGESDLYSQDPPEEREEENKELEEEESPRKAAEEPLGARASASSLIESERSEAVRRLVGSTTQVSIAGTGRRAASLEGGRSLEGEAARSEENFYE